MTERRKKVKQAKMIYLICVLVVIVSVILTVFVLRGNLQVLRTIVSVIGWAAVVVGIIFRVRKNKLICCPHCGVFLREEFIDSPQFTCLGCGKEVDNSKV